MMKISGSGCAAFAICLAFLQPASAQVNAETDARAFIVREAEIRRQAAAAEQGQDSQKSTTETAETKSGRKAQAKAGRTARAARTPLAAPAGSEGLRALVARHAAANGVPFALADAVVRIESRYNPRASNAGNYGLMQIRHQTARGVGYSGGASGLLDADTNARYAMKYLGQAYRLAGGDTCRTVMKYQSGHMATRMSGANRTYCAKVRSISGSAHTISASN
ncbi:lytic transglycosylase domain-containing protein [Bosea sp. (in: a-proteobacteria)]|jgi:soluble lytic murein transglycosylase-like protein|uniref:lytic transglycosylase domain-containing protein n=1 Tax=Bosea sp. (in: a-proteobacteria) TaxID=1871050 RepID=UPI002DDCA5C9|nr:lytic transglycosylase domain-containing protein [Bosea sp. (in: a-proteobacteria)]HEV2511130.1 lytic transglycosylase domain-containing protein [Bosea sp. (in: a-proteobacteria)]